MSDLNVAEIVVASISAKIKALRFALTEDQKEVFEEELKRLKENFLNLHKDVSPEFRKMIDEQFS